VKATRKTQASDATDVTPTLDELMAVDSVLTADSAEDGPDTVPEDLLSAELLFPPESSEEEPET